MDMPLRKVKARVDLNPAGPRQRSRPPSPAMNTPSPSSFRPKVKVVSDATVRKPSSASSLQHNVPRSRPGSPFKPPRTLPASSSPTTRITARPTSRSAMSPTHANSNNLESRQRALTAASAKLKLPQSEDRPRSGSVIALHHVLSISDINASSSPPVSHPLPPVETAWADSARSNTPPAPPPIKIKSKLTGLVKAASTSPSDATSRSLSPPFATTHPIYTRGRTPSLTSSFSSKDPPSSVFYPITTASPAANPHRYAPLRAQSPVRAHPSLAHSSEPHPTKKSSLILKVGPTPASLPPHSPPVSALSLSSKSSISRTSGSLDTDQTNDDQLSSAPSHVKHPSIERFSQFNPFLSRSETRAQTRRDRSRSTERHPRDSDHRAESDAESDGSERQLRAEAKTNRKIADLEITNRSLLAINASLETAKNRQAKEIRDLRRKLRESRLILPPRTYEAVKSASCEGEDEDEEDEDSSIEEEADETFQRVRGLINSLIESGRRALETRPEDLRASLATKVLNADELRSWRGSGRHTSMDNYHADKQDADDKTIQGLLSPALVAMPDSNSSSSAGSDRDPASNTLRPSPLPPITITHSL